MAMHMAHRWKKTGFGVLEVTILGPILLNILHNNLYIGADNTDFANYPDDNNIYDTGDCIIYFFPGKNVQNFFFKIKS